MAETFDMPFFEISCKNDVNVDASFLTLARMIKERTSQNVSSVLLLFYSYIWIVFYAQLWTQIYDDVQFYNNEENKKILFY